MAIIEANQKHVVVIGGGITGLSACWYLQTQADNPPKISLIESSNKLGGKMLTKKINIDEGSFIIDAGPESFVTRKREAWDLAIELGLEAHIINPGGETRNMYVLDGGIPKKIPLSPPEFIKSDLISLGGKLRLMMEPFIGAKGDDEDESLANFVTRRLGKEALEKMIGPVLAGIYNTNPETQSILVTSPIMREMEKEHGGLVRGAIARMRSRKKTKTDEAKPPQFMTFENGAQVMVDALAEKISAELFLSTSIRSIKKDGDSYTLDIKGRDPILADAIVITVPGNQASELIEDVDPESSKLIGKIEHENIGTATLVFKSDEIEIPYSINGLMIPRREKRKIDAITWTSNKPMDRAPENIEMIRVFFGGGDPSLVTEDKEKIVEIILSELRDILGIAARPIYSAVFCWPQSFPQAHVGHLDLVDKIENSLTSGLFVAGSSYRGIGIPDCIRQGQEAALRALKYIEFL